jgi:hypothetical protein
MTKIPGVMVCRVEPSGLCPSVCWRWFSADLTRLLCSAPGEQLPYALSGEKSSLAMLEAWKETCCMTDPMLASRTSQSGEGELTKIHNPRKNMGGRHLELRWPEREATPGMGESRASPRRWLWPLVPCQ